MIFQDLVDCLPDDGFIAGGQFKRQYPVFSENSRPVELTGATITYKIKKYESDSSTPIYTTTGVIETVASGEIPHYFTIDVPAANTATWNGAYWQEICITDHNNTPHKFQGYVFVSKTMASST